MVSMVGGVGGKRKKENVRGERKNKKVEGKRENVKVFRQTKALMSPIKQMFLVPSIQ